MKQKNSTFTILSIAIIGMTAIAEIYCITVIYNKVILFPNVVIEEETETETEDLVPAPDIDKQYLTINEWSRPGIPIKKVENIVIHYLGNPGTTAQENHDYFESLKSLRNESMSANYIIGLDGEIIQCIPDNEVAYASNEANSTSISIETCHPDTSGKLYSETYESLVKLVSYLADQYHLEREAIIRHFDVTGKACPLYYVENESAWDIFLDDVALYRSQYKAIISYELNLSNILAGTDYTY